MTENDQNTDQQPTEDAVNAENSPAAPEAPEVQEEPQSDPRNREAAKYRKQLREAEAGRDAAQQMLTAARSQILTTQFRGELHGLTVDALEAGGHTIDSFFSETGTLDADKLKTAAKDVAERFGLVQKLIIPNEGRTPDNPYAGNAWKDAFTAK